MENIIPNLAEQMARAMIILCYAVPLGFFSIVALIKLSAYRRRSK